MEDATVYGILRRAEETGGLYRDVAVDYRGDAYALVVAAVGDLARLWYAIMRSVEDGDKDFTMSAEELSYAVAELLHREFVPDDWYVEIPHKRAEISDEESGVRCEWLGCESVAVYLRRDDSDSEVAVVRCKAHIMHGASRYREGSWVVEFLNKGYGTKYLKMNQPKLLSAG